MITGDKNRKEKKYKILETVMLDFNTFQDQYSALFDADDKAQIIVNGSDVYLSYDGKRKLTINGPDLIDLYVKRGAVVEEKD